MLFPWNVLWVSPALIYQKSMKLILEETVPEIKDTDIHRHPEDVWKPMISVQATGIHPSNVSSLLLPIENRNQKTGIIPA